MVVLYMAYPLSLLSFYPLLTVSNHYKTTPFSGTNSPIMANLYSSGGVCSQRHLKNIVRKWFYISMCLWWKMVGWNGLNSKLGQVVVPQNRGDPQSIYESFLNQLIYLGSPILSNPGYVCWNCLMLFAWVVTMKSLLGCCHWIIGHE